MEMDSPCFCNLSAEAILCTSRHSSIAPASVTATAGPPRRRWDPPTPSSSLLSTMERFVQRVDEMNSTILVPCRLMDIEYQKGQQLDLYSFYNTLNSIKNDLMWGKSQVQVQPVVTTGKDVPPPQIPGQAAQQQQVKGHVRRPSSVSLNSSSTGSENDSGDYPLKDGDSDSGLEEEYSQQLADNFHFHRNGLYHCLRELTEVAETITSRYNQDIVNGI